MNFVTLSEGSYGRSVTVKEQAAVRASTDASCPVHDTVVGPRGKLVPDAGEQATATGSIPPE
jgi:hypothetical protein